MYTNLSKIRSLSLMIDCLVCLIDWLFGWIIHWLIFRLFGWLADWVSEQRVDYMWLIDRIWSSNWYVWLLNYYVTSLMTDIFTPRLANPKLLHLQTYIFIPCQGLCKYGAWLGGLLTLLVSLYVSVKKQNKYKVD